MKIEVWGKGLAVLGVGLVLALGLTGCGGGDNDAEPAPPSASETSAATQTSAPAETSAPAQPRQAPASEQTSEAPGGVPTAGIGGMVDGGYITFEAPAQVAWNVADSPAKGFAVARINVGSYP